MEMPLYRKRSQTDPYPAGSTYLFKPGPDRLSCQRIEAFWLKPEKLSRAGLPQLPGYSLYGKESGQGTADQSGRARATYYRIFHYKAIKKIIEGGLDTLLDSNQDTLQTTLLFHQNIRGKDSYK